MKKFIAVILTLMMVLSALAACGGSGKDESTQPGTSSTPTPSASETVGSSSSSETAVPSVSPSPSTTEEPSSSPVEPPVTLPSSSTLKGTKHLPSLVDNQGSIGCCSSEAVTYAQFTTVVSQYINSLDPDSKWDPSSGNLDYLFSAKYTYNFSGSGTSYAYDVLKTMGCLPMSVCNFYKTGGSSMSHGGSVITNQKSRSWDVDKEGVMDDALNYRITNYEEIEFTSTNDGKLTTNDTGKALLTKIKDAVYRGNPVVICGWSSYWMTTKIDNNGLGTLGKRNDMVIWNGSMETSSTSDGNHAVTIVGYDDDITVTVGGVTQKGAFQVMNSWGQWANNGFIWLTYDACNVVSEHALYRNDYFYQLVYGLVPASAKGTIPRDAGSNNLLSVFTPASTITLKEKEYTVYTITDQEAKKYLSYTADGKLSTSANANEYCYFAVIPYKDVDAKATGAQASSYVLYAVNSDKKYLSVTTTLTLEENYGSTNFISLAIDQSDMKEDGSFCGMVNTTQKTSTKSNYKRTGTIYRFSFLYWDKDVEVYNPNLRVEVAVSMLARESFNIVLTRTDKNGVLDTFVPATTRFLSSEGVQPGLGQQKDDKLSFSGIFNPTEPETGYFTFTFNELTKYSSEYDYDDFLWGIKVNGINTTVKRIRLISPDGKILSEILPDENAAPLVKGEVHSFFFDRGTELKSFFGNGSYRLKNVGTGEILSPLGPAGMLFQWDSGKPADAEKATINIVYNKETDSYRLWNYNQKYLIDINKNTVADGIIVKLNAENVTRDTQDWVVTKTAEGYLRISLKNYPEYAFGYDGKDFTLSSTDTSDNYLWVLECSGKQEITTVVSESQTGLSIAVATPEKYTEGEISLKIVKDGKVVETLTGTPDAQNGFTFEAALEKGIYLFTVMYDGEEQGAQIIYTYD